MYDDKYPVNPVVDGGRIVFRLVVPIFTLYAAWIGDVKAGQFQFIDESLSDLLACRPTVIVFNQACNGIFSSKSIIFYIRNTI
ncbi:hypothetical protein PN4B1_44110 [Paenibacillus naphthalenovorans]|nr:hypothetical protein PN4B1_44110 [Paenibacillus naphthalenovorans]